MPEAPSLIIPMRLDSKRAIAGLDHVGAAGSKRARTFTPGWRMPRAAARNWLRVSAAYRRS